MPVYDFECVDCEIMFEEKLSITESDKTVSCPFCQGRNTKKRLSVPIVFKKQSSSPNPRSQSSIHTEKPSIRLSLLLAVIYVGLPILITMLCGISGGSKYLIA